ncbi:hypothetical protein B6A42_07885 [Vibrio coralliilyticus]|nr:hypothetical protein B6A42_07885 [Vibrio coralliilyticus]
MPFYAKTQFKVLDAFKKREGVTAQQGAKRCKLSQSFNSTLLKELVEKGYLTRERIAVRLMGWSIVIQY